MDIELTEEVELQNDLKDKQESFLKSNLKYVVNNVLDIGIKIALPDLIEDEVISIKNTIVENGFKAGLDEAIKTAIDFGKSAIGIMTGNFENISQIDMAVRKGGIVDTVSNLLDKSIKNAEDKNLINKTNAKLIKSGKNNILSNLSKKIDDSLKIQVKNVEKLESYSKKWQQAYENKDFDTMDKNFKNIEKYLKTTIPLENTITEARKIENLHNLIKNNGKNFDISDEELSLAEKLV